MSILNEVERRLDRGNMTLIDIGAGNCNDVDLDLLAERYAYIHLVDVDEDALTFARDRVKPLLQQHIGIVGNLDLAGSKFFPTLASYANAQQDHQGALPQQTVELLRRMLLDDDPLVQGSIDAHLMGNLSIPIVVESKGFDVSISICVLSQIVDALVSHLSNQLHPQTFLPLLIQLRYRYLEALASVLKPGGVGIVVIDMVSFLSMKGSKYAKLKAEGDWEGLADLAEEENNFFHGTRRESVVAALKTGRLHDLVEPKSIKLLEPWQWNQGRKRFLVYGVVFSRR